MRATVLALGDLGRSPRIQLHAASLAEAGCDVDLVGFAGSPCWLLGPSARVSIRFVGDGRSHRSRILRGLSLSLSLSKVLGSLESPDVVLAQTPPALPALFLAARFGRARGARVVFDWHNLGFSLLALRTGPKNPAVRLYGWGEGRSARAAHAHLCVTQRLGEALRARFGVEARVFQDRPSRAFGPVSEAERLLLRAELLQRIAVPDSDGLTIVISPTSWTRDEDFELLASAGTLLDDRPGPPIVFIISGRGEQKASFESRVAGRPWGRVRFATAWFEGSDYARLLAGADLGLSLHASSSGADFPMKIHDMRGAGLPVLALRFPGLVEGFVEGRDGFGFASAAELAQRVSGRGGERESLESMRGAAAGRSWEESWQRDARPVILGR
ncbi:MAG: glycosyltransferase [Vicinamibacteria bacterium]|nr:glycosyltransferase [Vicinamibacteria bacterium]